MALYPTRPRSWAGSGRDVACACGRERADSPGRAGGAAGHHPLRAGPSLLRARKGRAGLRIPPCGVGVHAAGRHRRATCWPCSTSFRRSSSLPIGPTGDPASSLGGRLLSPSGIAVAAVSLDIALLAVVYLRIVRPGAITWKTMGLDKQNLGRRLLLGALFGLLMFVVKQRDGVHSSPNWASDRPRPSCFNRSRQRAPLSSGWCFWPAPSSRPLSRRSTSEATFSEPTGIRRGYGRLSSSALACLPRCT